MSGPSRRRNPIITRGKKSDKKKKKMEAQNRNITAPKDSFTELRQGMDSQRKELIKGNSPTGDKGILSEPSPLFFDRTEDIRSKKKDGYGMAILLEGPGYNEGVDISKVKQERMLVINGKRPSIFQDLPRQYKELEENLKQQEKESRTEVLDRGRKREEQNKKNAAKEAEKRRAEKEKLEAQRREEIEVKKREDAIRLAKSQAIEQERLDSQRKEKIEAERREELLRLEEAARLQEREQEKLDLQRKEKIEAEGLAENRTVFSPKQGFLHRLWKKIKNAILSKKSNQKNRLQEEVLLVGETVQQIDEIEEPEEVFEVVEVETLVEEIDIQEEVPVIEDTVQQIVEIEELEEVLVIGETLQQIDVIEEVETETLIEEIDVQEEVPVIEDTVQQIIESEEPEEDIEELPDFETGEVLLADLRITIKDEPLPIEFILKVLMEKHGLGKKDVNILIDHIASPFSVCKTMKGDLFERFIESFDEQNSQSRGGEIWTQIIQIIGLDSLSADQQVEIYNLFMGDKKKVNQKVRTLAILYHFIPLKFERWWQKEMIDSFTTKKYNSDYIYYQGKNFPEEIVEEARMLICAYAIEKPGLVAKAYTSAKHQAGKHHENRTERWLKKVAGKIEYLTEAEIQKFGGQKYGNKHVSTKITPDILLKKPIKLSKEGQHIHWIDAKKHFIDPALSPEYRVDSFCNQLEKYVRAYGPGLIVWGKDFSEEWNDATKGVVQHIKI